MKFILWEEILYVTSVFKNTYCKVHQLQDKIGILYLNKEELSELITLLCLLLVSPQIFPALFCFLFKSCLDYILNYSFFFIFVSKCEAFYFFHSSICKTHSLKVLLWETAVLHGPLYLTIFNVSLSSVISSTHTRGL